MFVPNLCARVVKRYKFSGQRIQSRHFGMFVRIASWTRECEVFDLIAALPAPWKDVLDRERRCGIILLIFAVLAISARPFKHMSAYRKGDRGVRYGASGKGQVVSTIHQKEHFGVKPTALPTVTFRHHTFPIGEPKTKVPHVPLGSGYLLSVFHPAGGIAPFFWTETLC